MRGIVKAEKLNVRKRATKKSDVVEVLAKGTPVVIVNERNGFGQLDGKSGWVMLEFIEIETEEDDERASEKMD